MKDFEREIAIYKLLEKELTSIVKIIINSTKNSQIYDDLKISMSFGKRILLNGYTAYKLCKPDEIRQNKFIFDTSSLFSILRNIYDSYTTFYHIFLFGGIIETELRKNLWILDSLNQRKQYPILKRATTIDPSNKLKITELIDNDKMEIVSVNTLIKNNSMFQNFEEKIQKKMLSETNWKFDRDKPNSRYSWHKLYDNTNMKELLYNDMYKHFCSHTHSSFLSLVQNDQLNDDSVQVNIEYAINLLIIAYSFMIRDYNTQHKIIEKHLISLDAKTIELINIYYKVGKKEIAIVEKG